MNFCNKCGGTISNKAQYCKSCGLRIKPFMTNNAPTEDKSQFCIKCGTKTSKKYCPICGTYAISTSIKGPNITASKIITTIGTRTQKQIDNLYSKTVGEDKFNSLKINNENFDIRSLLKNAGIFVIIMTVLTFILTFVCNGFLINNIIEKLQLNLDLSLSDSNSLKKMLNFKSIYWSSLYGMKSYIGLESKTKSIVDIVTVSPYVFLPFTVLFMWIAEFIRQKVTKSKRTITMVAASAFVNALISIFIVSILKVSKTINLADNIIVDIMRDFSYFPMDNSLNVTLKSQISSVTSYFITIFLVTGLILLILPGLKLENKIFEKLKNSIVIILGIVLAISVIPAIITIIRIKSTFMPEMTLGTMLTYTLMAIGFFASVILSGNVALLHISGSNIELNNLQLNSGITKLKYMQNYTNASGKNPFTLIHLIAGLIFIIVVLYVGWRLWDDISCDIKTASILSTIGSAIVAGVVTLLCKLTSFGILLSVNDFYPFSSKININLQVGNINYIGCFARTFIFVILLLMVSYLVHNHMSDKFIFMKQLTTKTVIITSIAVVLVTSFFNITLINMKSWNPFIDAVAMAYDANIDSEDIMDTMNEIIDNKDTLDATSVLRYLYNLID